MMPKAMNLIGRLKHLSETYCDAANVPLTRVSRTVFGDQRRLDRVFAGEVSMTIPSFERLVDWFSVNWPADLAWPDGIERPADDHLPNVGKMVPADAEAAP